MKEQQRSQAAEKTEEQQEDARASDNIRMEEIREAEEQRRDGVLSVMHKRVSREAAVRQTQILNNATVKREAAARIRESEIKQDAARGADTEALKKELRADVQEEARRAEQMQSFMFEGRSRKPADADEGFVNQISGSFRGKGLYDNGGSMLKTNFQSVQMDLRQ